MNKNQIAPFAVLLVSLAAVFVIIWGIKAFGSILNPILLATVITIVVLPLPQKLTKKGLPSWLSFILTMLLVVGVILLVIFLVFGTLTQITGEVSENTKGPGNSPFSPDQVNQFYGALVRWLGQGVALLFTVMIIFFFMLSAAISMPAASRPDLGLSGNAVTQVTKLTQDVRSYMSIMTGVNFMVGLGDVILLYILGVEYALLWGLLSWLMGYIPTVGFWIAMIPPLILAWTQYGLNTAIWVFVGYVLINGSVQNFIQPRMMGKGLGIGAVVVFLSLFFWGFLLGGIGAILAVPLTMIVMAVLNSFPNTRWIAVLMSAPRSEKDDDDGDGDGGARKQAQDKLKHTWHSVKHHLSGKDDDTQQEVVPSS